MSTNPPDDPWQQPGASGYPPPPPGWQQPGGYGYPPPPPAWQGPGGNFGSSSPAGVLAGWWLRVAATFIDALILAIPVAVIENSYKHSVAGRLIFVFILQALYNTLTIGSWGRTVGMRAVGTLVVDANTGNRFGMGRAFGRYCAEAVLGLPTLLFFGFLLLPVLDLLWPLWDARNQTLHDKIASTVVIRG